MKSKIAAALAIACTTSCFSGCASIVSGTSQQILVNTNPPGASCQYIREGTVIARVDQTPGAATINKTKDDITLKCNKQGYQEATYFNHSGVEQMVYGNMVIGGAVGWGIDSSLGADNHYDDFVNISMVPSPASMTPAGNSSCTYEQQVQARIARMNGYTAGPKCD